MDTSYRLVSLQLKLDAIQKWNSSHGNQLNKYAMEERIKRIRETGAYFFLREAMIMNKFMYMQQQTSKLMNIWNTKRTLKHSSVGYLLHLSFLLLFFLLLARKVKKNDIYSGFGTLLNNISNEIEQDEMKFWNCHAKWKPTKSGLFTI